MQNLTMPTGNVIVVKSYCSIILQSEHFVVIEVWRENTFKATVAFFEAVYFCMESDQYSFIKLGTGRAEFFLPIFSNWFGQVDFEHYSYRPYFVFRKNNSDIAHLLIECLKIDFWFLKRKNIFYKNEKKIVKLVEN